MNKNQSGQYVYFTLVTALSGYAATGMSGQISGRKSLDGLSGMIVLSGNIIELGGGSYRANLYDFDTNGNQVGFLFTCSGAVPVQYQFDMVDGLSSGHLFLGSGSITSGLIASGIVFVASGPNVVVPTATLSGVQPISGTTVAVPIASISGVQPISGTFVSVPIASISGVIANSGLFVVAGSGVNATVPIASISGAFGIADVRFVSGSAPAARQLAQRYQTAAAATIDDTNAAATRYVFEVNNFLSGDSQASFAGQILQAVISSGGTNLGFLTTVRATAAPNSGRTQLTVYPGLPQAPLSGDALLGLGVNAHSVTSGGYGAVQSGQLSGQQVTLTSGQSYPASGVNATVPISSISGTVVNSGLFVTVPIATISGVQPISGTFVTVPISSISGTVANSGLFATVLPATISGVVANSGLNVNADVIRWRTVQPNNLTASGHVDASFAVRAGVARSGTATTIQLDAGAPTGASGIYDGQLIYVVAGSGADEVRRIAFYDSSGNVTVDRPFVVAPFANSIFNVLPQQGTQSGAVYPVSGAFVTVPLSSISGVQPISGTFVTVPKATLSGVIANSGLFVTATATVDPASISGVFATVPIATISGVIANSGLFVTATATVGSGVLYLASGSIFMTTFASGVVGGGSGNLPSAWGGSGMVAVGTVLSGITQIASGPNVVVPTASISGVVANSGLFVTVPIATISGVQPISGTFVSVPIASISGVRPQSGAFVTVPPATLSGVVANSGLTVTVVPATVSGAFVTVPTDTISGVVANSGLFVTVPTATLSGVQPISGASVIATTYSGTTQLASGEVTYRIPYNVLSFDLTNFSGLIASGLSGRNVVNAARKLTNKWDLSAVSGYLRVYQEDDVTVAYDQAVTSASGADPITSLDTK